MLMKELHGFTVEKQVLLVSEIRVLGPAVGWNRGLARGRRAQMGRDIFMRDDRSGPAGVHSRHVASGDGAARLGEFLVAADMIRAGAGVEDIVDRLIGNRTDGCNYLIGYAGVL